MRAVLEAVAIYWLLAVGAVRASIIPQAPEVHKILPRQQDQNFTWAIVGYSQPACQGEVVANWRGRANVPACIDIKGTTASISGGSGSSAVVYLWEDQQCTRPAGDLVAAGKDANEYPCFNAVVRAFSVGTTLSQGGGGGKPAQALDFLG